MKSLMTAVALLMLTQVQAHAQSSDAQPAIIPHSYSVYSQAQDKTITSNLPGNKEALKTYLKGEASECAVTVFNETERQMRPANNPQLATLMSELEAAGAKPHLTVTWLYSSGDRSAIALVLDYTAVDGSPLTKKLKVSGDWDLSDCQVAADVQNNVLTLNEADLSDIRIKILDPRKQRENAVKGVDQLIRYRGPVPGADSGNAVREI